MPRSALFTLVFSFCCVLLTCCQQAEHAQNADINSASMPSSFEARLQAVFTDIERQKLDVIIAITHNNSPIVIREFGRPASDGIAADMTQVDINSVTKTVTGIMAAKLVEQKKVRFDDTLGGLFDNVPADKSAITLQQLLTHTAGFNISVGADFEPIDQSEFLARAFSSELISSPGSTYHYSNVGYGVVAAIIELRSGKSYENFLHEDVLAGLGLKNTGYAGVYEDSRSLKTRQGKTVALASWGGGAPYWNLIGNGGLISTVQDMIRFRQAVNGGKVISEDLLALVQTPHVLEDEGASSFYGFGLVVEDVDGVGRFYWHDGGNEVFSAQWGDYTRFGDVIFVAGIDDDAFKAMRLVEAHLYGYGEPND